MRRDRAGLRPSRAHSGGCRGASTKTSRGRSSWLKKASPEPGGSCRERRARSPRGADRSADWRHSPDRGCLSPAPHLAGWRSGLSGDPGMQLFGLTGCADCLARTSVIRQTSCLEEGASRSSQRGMSVLHSTQSPYHEDESPSESAQRLRRLLSGAQASSRRAGPCCCRAASGLSGESCNPTRADSLT